MVLGDIRWYHQCQHCAKVKGPPLRPHGQLQKIPVGTPMDLVTMDILSGLPTADDGSKYLLVVVDAFTKWVEAYPLPDQEAATCITAVYSGMFSRFGLPRQLHSDQGRNFESQLVTGKSSTGTPTSSPSHGKFSQSREDLLRL